MKQMRLYLDEIGAQAAGRKIELIVEDTEGKPDVGLTKARKLVERDQVHVLAGIVSTAVALAVQGYVREKQIPLILNADAGANLLTMPGPLLNPYVFRFSQTSAMPAQPAADWAYKDAGWRKVVTITSDYAGGLEVMGGFVRVFCSLGGHVIQELYPPLGTADFAPFLTRVDRSADAVVAFTPGADGLRLGRQYQEYGFHGKLPLLDIYGQITFESNLPQLKEALLGVYSAIHYTSAIDTPENKRFVAAFKARYNRLPFDNGPDGYVGARAIAEALKAIGGDVEKREKFMAALKKVEFDSAKGRIRLDQFQNVIQNEYIRRVDRVGNEYVNVPVKTYSNVSQFWTWTPEEYMKYPVFTAMKGKQTDCAKVLERK
ncbi:MAG: ABC transporter substrate-binding protein [Candidatus Rokubacteria bacterium]|nr:ABC transporter substrate-binding protein [Candidatus Rokubacteria bacterium]